MTPTTGRRLTRNRVGLLIGLGLILLAALGEALGWWRDWGLVLGALGIMLTVWFGIDTASEATVDQLGEPLGRMADDMATVRVTLQRIETLLGGRPPLGTS
jgi:hypothetical protein